VSEADEQTPITPAWLDYKQAEAYSNLSRTTLWQLINARKIRAARIGRAVRIERESLQEFMERSSDQW
jgi:excisionase family DNA binding protein